MFDFRFALSWNYKGQKGKETLFHTAIGNTQTSLKNWAPAFKRMITEVLEPAVDEQFATEGHGTWAELAPSTIKRKGNAAILIDTGVMLGSFHVGGESHYQDIQPQSMRWGSLLARALFHQTGTLAGFQQRQKAGGPGVPMRKILELNFDQKSAMRSIMVSLLATIARREGFGVSGGSITDPLSARQLGQRLLGL